MTVRIPSTSVSPLVAVKWHIESLKDELAALDERAKRVPEFPPAKVQRAKRDAIDRCIRAQYYFGWTKGSRTSFLGILYRELSFQHTIEAFLNTSDSSFRTQMEDVEKQPTIEHVIPVAALRDQILANSEVSDKDVAESLLAPVALLSKKTEKLIREISTTKNLSYPFQRYAKHGIEIVVHDGTPISENWSIGDHGGIVAKIPAFKEVMNYYGIGNRSLISR